MIECSTCKHYRPYSPSPDDWRKPTGTCEVRLPPWVAHQLHDEAYDRTVFKTDVCHFHNERKVEV